MKNRRLFVALLAAVFVGTVAALSASASDPAPGALLPALNLAMVNNIPPPPDDPLRDAAGNIVMDANGNPVSDPNEGFHAVIPHVYDPAHTNLVESGWLDGIGCPTGANVATYPATSPTGTYTDPACDPSVGGGDPKDKLNEGLLLVKTGPLENNAAAGAELKKVKGIVLNELGYDIRKNGGFASVSGSHCGAGAPRFNVFTTDGFWAVGCSSPPPDTQTLGDGFTRLRWGVGGVVMGYKDNAVLSPITGTVQRIQIVFDEGTDAASGTGQFGLAVLDNIDVNSTLVGRGPDEG